MLNIQIEKAAAIIRNGGIVAFPTETVYGLGADAFNAGAVARVFAVKKRPRFDPLIVHIEAWHQIGQLAAYVPDEAERLAEAFWPGPLKKIGLLAFDAIDPQQPSSVVEILSPSGDLAEAACNLFAALKRLDNAGLDLIVAMPFPDQGLGRAINDRIGRAAQRNL